MTKKDYILIANSIKQVKKYNKTKDCENECINILVSVLCENLIKDNKSFDSFKFKSFINK